VNLVEKLVEKLRSSIMVAYVTAFRNGERFVFLFFGEII